MKEGETDKNLFSKFKAELDNYYGDVDTYRNGLEKFFKQYAGLILGIVSILVVWELNVYVGVVLAVISLYICKYLRSQTVRIVGIVCCCATIFIFILWLLLM